MKQTKSFHLEINENSTYLSKRLCEYSLYYFYFATSCELGIISKHNIKKKIRILLWQGWGNWVLNTLLVGV